MKTIFGIKLALLVCFALYLSVGFADNHTYNSANDPAIFWDEVGNVHIFASSEAELHFAWGWAQMRDNTKILLNAIDNGRPGSSFKPSDVDGENYQLFADGMNGFLNRRLDTLTPAHKALLPLSGRDIVILKQNPVGKWRNIFLHQPEFIGAGVSELGYPQITIDTKVEAVSREVLMEDFRQLELLLPLTLNE